MDDEAASERIVRQTADPHLQSPNADPFLKGMRLQERTHLWETSGQVFVDRFNQALLQFMWEEVPLERSQTAFAEVVSLFEDDDLNTEFAPFLNAKLGADATAEAEAEAEARAALCRIVGLPATMRKPENADKREERVRALIAAVNERWADQPEQAEAFVATFLEFAEPGPAETKKRGRLWVLVKNDEEVRRMLAKYYQETGEEEDEDYSSGPAFG